MSKFITNDVCHVQVFDNNIEGAIRQLKKRFCAAGIHEALRLRRDNPSRAARRKAKMLRSQRRTRRAKAG